MELVQKQKALLQQQKSSHDARQQLTRKLTEQRQQLEAVLRQNSELLQTHKVTTNYHLRATIIIVRATDIN